MSNISKIKESIETLDQLVWLLKGDRLNELDDLVDFIKKNLKNDLNYDLGSVGVVPNKDYLVGSLPALLQDLNLFPKNEDIVDFAKEVLDINIIHGYKKSRHEIIGRVVCETLSLDDRSLSKLVNALKVIKSDESRIIKMQQKKIGGVLSWNLEIQELLRIAK